MVQDETLFFSVTLLALASHRDFFFFVYMLFDVWHAFERFHVFVERRAQSFENFISFELTSVWMSVYTEWWIHLDATHVIGEFSINAKQCIVAFPVSRNRKGVPNAHRDGTFWYVQVIHNFAHTFLMQRLFFTNTLAAHLIKIAKESMVIIFINFVTHDLIDTPLSQVFVNKMMVLNLWVFLCYLGRRWIKAKMAFWKTVFILDFLGTL